MPNLAEKQAAAPKMEALIGKRLKNYQKLKRVILI
jgi:hypothetical protein